MIPAMADGSQLRGWDPASRSIAGTTISAVGMGCNSMGTRLDRQASISLLRGAVDRGITFFDTADVYGMGVSEEVVGEALRPMRDEVVIATKFGGVMTGDPAGSGGSPAWVRTAAEASMRRLGVEHIDLYYLHRLDPEVPIDETLGALADLVAAGSIAASGVSKADESTIRATAATARDDTGFDFVQNEYSLLERSAEEGELEAARLLGLGFVPYFPLASGVLSGGYVSADDLPATSRLTDSRTLRERYLNDATAAVVGAVRRVAERREVSMAQVAIAWLLSRSGVTSVIAGATTPMQVADNVGAASVRLTAEDLADLDAGPGP